MADVSETRPVTFPSSEMVRRLSIVASALSAAAIGMQAAVKVAQQAGKSKQERAGLETAVRLTIVATLARAIPAILGEIRTISRELRR
jgi:uncharacterized protein YybS (DUF2232 family)